MADGEIIINTKINSEGAEDGAKRLGKSMQEVSKSADDGDKKVSKFGDALKKVGAAVGKAVLAGLGAAATAISALVKSSVEAYSDFEQLKGGVETIFGAGGKSLEEYAASVNKTVSQAQGEYNKLMTAQQNVLDNAARAYYTAGLSANDYMQTVTSFSASLIQSVGGDTVKAAEIADRAIIDMSDNANKFGTDMVSIQNAYQGFAKQNYTMLDNLKLGYGGTQKEMERLIKDASKMKDTQKELNITVKDGDMSFANIANAISVVQANMGIAGATADEAMRTIQGSAAMTRAAWQNMMVAIADDNADFDASINGLVESVSAFAKNIIPRIETALAGVGKLVENLAPVIVSKLPSLVEKVLPALISAAMSLFNSLVAALPSIVSVFATEVIPTIITGLQSTLPQLGVAAIQIISTLATGLSSSLPQLIPIAMDTILQFAIALIENIPLLVQSASDLIIGLAQGLISAIPILIPYIPQIVMAIGSALLDSVSIIAKSGLELIKTLGQAMYNAAPDSLKNLIDSIGNAFKQAWEVVKTVWNVVKPYFQAVWEGIRAVFSVVSSVLGAYFKSAWEVIKGVWNVVTSYFKAVWDTIAAIFSVVKSVLSGDFKGAWDAIKSIVSTWAGFFRGVWDTIRNVFSNVASYFGTAFKNAFAAIKSAFSSIGSYFSQLKSNIVNVFSNIGASFRTIGQNIVNGIKNGISAGWNALKNFVSEKARSLLNAAKSALGIASPSKLFRDQIGKFIPAGISVGIEANEASAIAAMEDLSKRLMLSTKPMLQAMPAMATGTVIPSNIAYSIERSSAPAESTATAQSVNTQAGKNVYNVSATVNGRNIFQLIIDEAQRYRMETGRNPFDLTY